MLAGNIRLAGGCGRIDEGGLAQAEVVDGIEIELAAEGQVVKDGVPTAKTQVAYEKDYVQDHDDRNKDDTRDEIFEQVILVLVNKSKPREEGCKTASKETGKDCH